MEPQLCPKCGGRMERGFVLDQDVAPYFAIQWCEGIPKPAFLTGVKLPERRIKIIAMRCTACGFLETYAPEDPASDSQT